MKIIAILFGKCKNTLYIYIIIITQKFTTMKNTARFNEVTEKLNKMFKGSEEQKDKLVSDLKNWLKANRNSDDKDKVEAIQCFLAEKNIF